MKSAIVIFIGGLMIGAAALVTFDGLMYLTSTDKFCGGSCHEMSTPLALRALIRLTCTGEIPTSIPEILPMPTPWAI